MKDFIKRLTSKENPCNIWAMSNILPRESGTTKVIWISQKMGKHGPRIKLGNRFNNTISISISDDPKIVAGKMDKNFSQKDIDKAIEWILLNKEILLDFWEGNLSTIEALPQLKKI